MNNIEYDVKNLILKSIIINLNTLLGNSKSSVYSLDFILKFPINVSVNIKKEPDSIDDTFLSLIKHSSIFTKFDDTISVYIELSYGDNITRDEIIEQINNNQKEFAMLYLHEIQHLIRSHNTKPFNRIMENIITKNGSKFSISNHELINVAEDFAINDMIKQIASGNKEFSKSDFFTIGCYDKKYENKSEMNILKDLMDNANMSSEQLIFSNGTNVNIDGKSVANVGECELDKNDEDKNMQISSLQKSIESILNNAIQAGDLSSEIKEKTGLIKSKIDLNWFSKVSKILNNQAYYLTKDYYTSWKKIKNKYRHIAHFPSNVYVENILNIIISIDQSGSVSDQELGKLYYLMEEIKNSVKSIYIIYHDYECLEPVKYNKSLKTDDIDGLFGVRLKSGGTSHKQVFEHIDNILNKEKHSKYVYMCFSDMESDIESINGKHKWFNNIDKIWLNTGSESLNEQIYTGTIVNI